MSESQIPLSLTYNCNNLTPNTKRLFYLHNMYHIDTNTAVFFNTNYVKYSGINKARILGTNLDDIDKTMTL